jgi:hypothetical protein
MACPATPVASTKLKEAHATPQDSSKEPAVGVELHEAAKVSSLGLGLSM